MRPSAVLALSDGCRAARSGMCGGAREDGLPFQRTRWRQSCVLARRHADRRLVLPTGDLGFTPANSSLARVAVTAERPVPHRS